MFERFNTVYTEKKGLFSSEKFDISLTLFEDIFKGIAFKSSGLSASMYSHKAFSFDYGSISNYEICDFENIKSLKIDIRTEANNNEWIDSYYFPFGINYNVEDIIGKIDKYMDNYRAEQNALIQIENEKLQREEQARQHLAEIQNFYDKIYRFHISENTPVYTIRQNGTNCLVVFIGEDKSFNFLLIEGETETEIHSVISYEEIHYYEKAGDVHFATKINASYTSGCSYGGSFVGSRIYTSAATVGGLLFGQMGMAIGAMASYKPAEYTPPKSTPSQFNISSEITKIDERNVILNYYSVQHKQYVDIELPQEIYNFLQTFIPDKKYAIVIEKEKQTAVTPTLQQSSGTANTTIERLQKLKQLYEMQLITEEEYSKRKKEILAEL